MTETMTPHEAARVVAEASRYEAALVERTAGLTWMIWGLATPAIFLTYAFAIVLGGSGWWMSLLWAPWVAAANLATFALWRSAALAAPSVGGDGGFPYALRALAFVLLIFLGMWFFGGNGAAGPLMVVGVAWAAMGALNLWRMSVRSRRVALLAGGLLAVAGLGLMAASPSPAFAGMMAIVVSGVVPLAAGLYQTLRG